MKRVGLYCTSALGSRSEDSIERRVWRAPNHQVKKSIVNKNTRTIEGYFKTFRDSLAIVRGI